MTGATLITIAALASSSAQTPTTQTAPPKQTEPVTSRPAADPAGQPANIKIDLTITDQTGPGDGLKKVVTMVVADRGNGSIRSTGNVRAQGRVQINVDASPTIVQNGAIRLRFSMEYNPRMMSNDAPTESSSLNEQLTVILDAGKPMVVSQAPDPASDRKIAVEIRTTVLR